MLVLILIAAVASEWVEISQHHYRTPIRTSTDKILHIEDSDVKYTNYSLDHNHWNYEGNKFPKLGDVKPVKVDRDRTKDNSHREPEKISPAGIRTPDRQVIKYTDTQRKQNNLETSSNAPFNYNRKDYIPRRQSATHIRTDPVDKVKGIVQRMPNVGSVRRVQLADTPVKSPSFRLKPEEAKLAQNDEDKSNNQKDQTKITETKHTDKEYFNQYQSNIKKIHEATNSLNSNTRTKLSEGFDNFTRIINVDRPQFVTEEESVSLDDKFRDFDTTESIVFLAPTSNQGSYTETYAGVHIKADNPVFVTKDNIRHENQSGNNEESNDKTATNAGNKNPPTDDPKSKGENTLKENTMEHVLTIMKVVADTISKNSRRSFGGKIKYLQELKHSILANIKDRIDSTWPDDTSEAPGKPGLRGRSRAARGATQVEPRGHVEFPSSEGALMTISFLTFAVFLIKLVLQVIQTYKNKTMLVAPLVVATARRLRERRRN